MELYFRFPNMTSWRGAQLKNSTGTTLHLPLPYQKRKETSENKLNNYESPHTPVMNFSGVACPLNIS
jgi:hypothetical protein